VTATPYSGYTFAYWTENNAVVSSSASYTFTLSANRTLVAIFSTGTPITTSVTLGENTVFSDVDSGNGNLLVVQDATLSQTATIQSLSFYVSLADGELRLGIYDATGPGGGPGALIAQTRSFTPVVGWNTKNVIAPVSLPAGNYWLAYLPSSSNLQFAANFYIGSFVAAQVGFGPMPATFPTNTFAGTTHWSLYATLTTP
jgi:hypothetical protein